MFYSYKIYTKVKGEDAVRESVLDLKFVIKTE